MKTELYTITTLTNLHVGSGEVNFDIIDNQVQKDAITKLPNINSSSLKGALREAFRSDINDKDEIESNLVKFIFGPSNDDNDSHQTGAYNFFEASLLTRPVRSSAKSYFNATSPAAIKSLLYTIENFEIDFDEDLKNELKKLSALKPEKNKPIIFENIQNTTYLEDVKAVFYNFNTSNLKEFLGEDLALFEDNELQELDLPVLARNYLVEGESKNLWYEEVVPKKTKFFFCIAKPINLDNKDKQEKLDGYERQFEKKLSTYIQLGANKSIGYGYSKIVKVSK
ncbi:MAG: type III-B CRISPR module RAMP protein Cmr4 [Sulfurimonas sp. RIFCSPLOWO2_12_36_12]|uniref:type III-B CRISPR module RAMP protein Cmr4 n=1 Tax=Sulfurimonas sp. RIFCSPLOWO2_12_36_12 TaxID=1802253 RepID=UPI0008D07609|nr:type III-B CRISPR module RAMP protein Cmr4 [Sulfurimonas sp. RIFCSPLOWO2_12_36_12]OHD99249.1 MAG: type III-B CRISPR module RAMP protein Cmr4 [Sulfurimonas sp. RIFCSPLOWO2_02_FULL_36_28]OHE02871.1 MAG: type III-B CRISPR module RAMP protein Cmr4 [Sulfurimonas sp. RIFCSPLOWO2_12_36_12]